MANHDKNNIDLKKFNIPELDSLTNEEKELLS